MKALLMMYLLVAMNIRNISQWQFNLRTRNLIELRGPI